VQDVFRFGVIKIRLSGHKKRRHGSIVYRLQIILPINTLKVAHSDAALKVLRSMQQQHLAGDKFLRSNTITYNTVISAFARAGQAERAEALVEEMYSDYLDGNDSAKPNVRSFSVVLDAWSKSRSRDAPQWAEAILERMTQLHSSGGLDTKPNIVSYSSVINCWANSGSKEAPDAALKLLRTMQQQHLAGDKS
jgi:pentatricopeptide repeat protein